MATHSLRYGGAVKARSKEPGTRCRIWYEPSTPDQPVGGDLMATRTGTSYLIVSVRESPSRPGRLYLICERLPKGSCQIGEAGVWPLYWLRRGG